MPITHQLVVTPADHAWNHPHTAPNFVVTLFAEAATGVVLTTLPNVATEIGTGTAGRTRADLTQVSHVRIIGMQHAAAAVPSVLWIKYALTQTGIWTFLNLYELGPSVDLSPTADTPLRSEWCAIDAAAQADVYLAGFAGRGDGVASPSFSHLAIEVR